MRFVVRSLRRSALAGPVCTILPGSIPEATATGPACLEGGRVSLVRDRGGLTTDGICGLDSLESQVSTNPERFEAGRE